MILDRLQSVNVYSQSRGINVLLMQVANVNYETSFARIARENLFRTVTVESKNTIMSAENMVPLLEPGLEKSAARYRQLMKLNMMALFRNQKNHKLH